MSLKAAKLRHIVSIEDRIEFVDSAGDRVSAWVPVFPRVYAAIEPLSVKELMAVGADQSEVVARITVRYRPGITHRMRIAHGADVYHIEGAQRDPASGLEWLTLSVSKGLRDEQPL